MVSYGQAIQEGAVVALEINNVETVGTTILFDDAVLARNRWIVD
jgi:hypothetical protein